eukprot:GHVP01068299.1.p2 GENE.GHVP01068299.1~~GHVP01068299.1.p2  ORF type:complete len:188 (-),score=44.58 GHVP01068299.1:562-1125(-)
MTSKNNPPGYCEFCGSKASEKVWNILERSFCSNCFYSKEEFEKISQKRAATEYGLSSTDLQNAVIGKRITCVEVQNPSGFKNKMKLYYRLQLAEEGTRKFGSLDALMEETLRRRSRRIEEIPQKSAKVSLEKEKSKPKANKEKRQKEESSSQVPKCLEHKFKEDFSAEGTEIQQCSICGFTVTWEII